MAVRFRNDFGEGRVTPMLDYILIDPGQVITVPDGEWEHWDAGGWAALDPDPRLAAAAAPAVVKPAPPAVTATPEGDEVA